MKSFPRSTVHLPIVSPCITVHSASQQFSCRINSRDDCHVGILLQMKGLRYFIDVANAKPYTRALQISDSSINASLNGSFHWGLKYSPESRMMQLLHHSPEGSQVAVEFHPATTVKYSSFRDMICKSRSDASFGPFLTSLRICVYPDKASKIIAIRDACIYDGCLSDKRCACSRDELVAIARSDVFAHIEDFSDLVEEAIDVLDREHPDWFDESRKC